MRSADRSQSAWAGVGTSFRQGPGRPVIWPFTVSSHSEQAVLTEVQKGKGWDRWNWGCLDALYNIWYFENTLHLPVSKSRWDSNKFSQCYYPGLLMRTVWSDWFAPGLSIPMEPPYSLLPLPVFIPLGQRESWRKTETFIFPVLGSAQQVTKASKQRKNVYPYNLAASFFSNFLQSSHGQCLQTCCLISIRKFLLVSGYFPE